MVENWRSSPGMPPLMRDVLDRIVLERNDTGKVISKVYVRGYLPHGRTIQGWTGTETVIIREFDGVNEKTIDYETYIQNKPDLSYA